CCSADSSAAPGRVPGCRTAWRRRGTQSGRRRARGPGAEGRKPVGGALAEILDEVAAGRVPPADGEVTILPQDSPRHAGVTGFPAQGVIFVDADPAWVASQLPPGDLSGPLTASFLHALCVRTGRTAHSVDMLALAGPLPGPPPVELVPLAAREHP